MIHQSIKTLAPSPLSLREADQIEFIPLLPAWHFFSLETWTQERGSNIPALVSLM